jgi:hypothetical protein
MGKSLQWLYAYGIQPLIASLSVGVIECKFYFLVGRLLSHYQIQ